MRPLLLVALPAFWFASSEPSRAARSAPTGCDLWTHEPLVAYDATGATLSGPLDCSLRVHNDGTVRLFSRSAGSALVEFVPPSIARGFARDLLVAGASTLCDGPVVGSDVPLRTLTVFRGATDATPHTVNGFGGVPTNDALNRVIDAFVAGNLP